MIENEVENSDYIEKCPQCNEVLKFSIDHENYILSIECLNGHYIQEFYLEINDNNYIQLISTDKIYCNKCYHQINDNNFGYKCRICKKTVCMTCIIKYNQKRRQENTINFIKAVELGEKNNPRFLFNCEYCNNNFYTQSKAGYNNNSIKIYTDFMPNTKYKMLRQITLKNLEKKLNKISVLINDYKNNSERIQ